ncbi:MAG: uroporphyrinogen-III synthase [Ruminococcus callidus]
MGSAHQCQRRGTTVCIAEAIPVDLRRLLHLRFAAIGNGTAQALAEYGIFVDCVPEYFNSRSLAETLIPQLTMQDRVLCCERKTALSFCRSCWNSGESRRYSTVVSGADRPAETGTAVAGTGRYGLCFLASASATRAFAEMTAEQKLRRS